MKQLQHYEAIITLHKSGVPPSEIKERFGIKHSNVVFAAIHRFKELGAHSPYRPNTYRAKTYRPRIGVKRRPTTSITATTASPPAYVAPEDQYLQAITVNTSTYGQTTAYHALQMLRTGIWHQDDEIWKL